MTLTLFILKPKIIWHNVFFFEYILFILIYNVLQNKTFQITRGHAALTFRGPCSWTKMYLKTMILTFYMVTHWIPTHIQFTLDQYLLNDLHAYDLEFQMNMTPSRAFAPAQRCSCFCAAANKSNIIKYF